MAQVATDDEAPVVQAGLLAAAMRASGAAAPASSATPSAEPISVAGARAQRRPPVGDGEGGGEDVAADAEAHHQVVGVSYFLLAFRAAYSLGIGVPLLYYGLTYYTAPCEVAIQPMSVAYGVVNLAMALLAVASMLYLYAVRRLGRVAGKGFRRIFQATQIASAIIAIGQTGISIWGFVIVFGSSRFSRYQSGQRDFCEPQLYLQAAVILIVDLVLSCCTSACNNSTQRRQPVTGGLR